MAETQTTHWWDGTGSGMKGSVEAQTIRPWASTHLSCIFHRVTFYFTSVLYIHKTAGMRGRMLHSPLGLIPPSSCMNCKKEAFIDVFCDLMYGRGWMEIEQKEVDQECNWALVSVFILKIQNQYFTPTDWVQVASVNQIYHFWWDRPAHFLLSSLLRTLFHLNTANNCPHGFKTKGLWFPSHQKVEAMAESCYTQWTPLCCQPHIEGSKLAQRGVWRTPLGQQ